MLGLSISEDHVSKSLIKDGLLVIVATVASVDMARCTKIILGTGVVGVLSNLILSVLINGHPYFFWTDEPWSQKINA